MHWRLLIEAENGRVLVEFKSCLLFVRAIAAPLVNLNGERGKIFGQLHIDGRGSPVTHTARAHGEPHFPLRSLLRNQFHSFESTASRNYM